MHDHVCFIGPIDYCVEYSLVYETFYENCSHFILKWFQANSFEEVCFLEEGYEIKQKNSNFDNFESIHSFIHISLFSQNMLKNI